MKKKWLFILLSLVMAEMYSQTYQQTDIVLDSEIPKDQSMLYEASTSITLLNGFRYEPQKKNDVTLSIDRYGVFPPDDGMIGGPIMSDQDGVVGALPGNLNVSDIGAAIYSMPLQIPQGLGKMTPEISVVYDSQSGNGLLGWCWDLSGLSSIVRTGKTYYHDGEKTAVNLLDDRFVMDGKRLMLCAGNYGGNGAVYKTEVDEMSKIVSYTDGYNGPAKFKVHKKDGTVWEYGYTQDSRVEPQTASDFVLTWLVNKISDPDGNSIVFNYVEHQSFGESYINYIDYTLNDNAGIQSMYRLSFEYSDREDVESYFIFGNNVQKKKILSKILVKNMNTGAVLYEYSFDYLEPGNYAGDYKFLYYRLAKVGLAAKGVKLNSTKINWNKKSHYQDKFLSYSQDKNIFNKMIFVGDFNGDGVSDALTVPYKTGNSYLDEVIAPVYLNDANGSFYNEYYTFYFDNTLEWVYVVDLNGDGLDDVVAFYAKYASNDDWKSKIVAYLNYDGYFSYLGEYQSTDFFTIYPGDFLAEDKVGFLLKYEHTNNSKSSPCAVYYADGSFATHTLGGQLSSINPERIVVEDIDADGRAEIIFLKADNAIIAKMFYENNAYELREVYTDDNFDSDDFLFPGDFNGDGYTDFLKYDDRTYWKIAFSDGQRLRTPVNCLNNNLLRGLMLAPQDRYYCSLKNMSAPSVTIRTADFDGDGKTDVGVFKNTGGNHYMEIGFKMCESANGDFGFSDIKRFYLNINHSHQYVHVGNFLGHENASILGSVKSNPYNAEFPKIVSLNPHSSKFCVERITDGLGNSRGFKYAYLVPSGDEFYTYNYRWINEGLRTVAIPFKALASDTVFSINNKPCVTKYSYKNAMYHPKGHGLIGFEQSETKLLVGNSVSESRVFEKDVDFMDDYFIALPKTCSIYNYSGQLVALEQYEYEKYSCTQNAKTVMPLISNKRTIFYDFDIPNAVLKTKIESFDYQSDIGGFNYTDFVKHPSSVLGVDDSYTGNDASACSYREETNYVFNDNPAAWIVARPQSISYSKHYGDNDAVGSCDIFDYSGNNAYQVTKKTSLPNANMNFADPLKIVADYSYDNVGHAVTQVLTSPSSKNQRVTSLTYGEEYNHRYPTSTVNENGWETYHFYDKNYGNLLSTVDYNQFETKCSSDPFEITVEKMLPDGIINVKTKRWANGNKHAPQLASYYCWEKTKGKAETMAFFSKTGKKLRDVSFNPNGEAVYVDMAYDDYGNMISKSMPYIAGDDIDRLYYVYDKNNRLIEEVWPNGTVKNYHYNKLQTTINTVSPDGVSNNVVETNNAMGWRVQTVDIGGNTINYAYYSDGKLKSAVIGDNPMTKVEYEYDNRRNVLRMKDPACGEVQYEYNAYGELLEMRSPKNCITTYNYDNMGNLIGRAESDGNGGNVVATQWIYDNKKGKIGTLSKIIYGNNHIVSYYYDDLLRITSVTENIKGISYVTNYSYDNANREDVVTYSSGLTVQKKYSNSGYYMSMIDADDETVLWRTDKTNALGRVTDYQMGNGMQTTLTYDAKTNLLCGIFTQKDKKVYQDLSYSYDGFGNLTNRSSLTGNKHSESFVYDDFNRLVEIRKDKTVTGEMEYDNYGNILSKSIDGKSVYYDAHYDGDSPYAVSKVTTDWDNLSGMNQSVAYTAFDKISDIQTGNNSYSIGYGYDYERIYSVEMIDGKKKEKVYAGDCEYVDFNGKNAAYTYLRGPMGVFAVCCTDENGEKSMKYVHKDHLGSWCLITDEDGKVLQKTSYDAWGNPRNADTWSGGYSGELLCDRGFTGHEHLSSFGIINMNGRAYDPMLSMMMSPDNYIQCPDMSQNYNRYSYCWNNPLSYHDPSGEWVEWLLYGIFNGVMNLIFDAPNIDDLGEGLLAFTAGFVQGCLTNGFSESAWIWQVAGNVAGNTLKAGVNNFIKQNDGSYDWDKIDTDNLKHDVMYTLGSSLASAALGSYIVHPTETEQGVSFASMLCGSTLDQEIFENTIANVAGNVFAGQNLFDVLGIDVKNGDFGKYVIPSVVNFIDVYAEKLGQIDNVENMGWAYRTILKINDLMPKNNYQMGVGDNYSMIRSLFLKI